MMHDPIEKTENLVKHAQTITGKYTRPTLKRYPLLFSFLVVFSAAAIIHGFETWAHKITLFEEHPIVLMLLGVGLLFLTGSLYKVLEHLKEIRK